MTPSRWNRRRFLCTTALSTFPLIIPARALGSARGPGANDRIRVGLIGSGYRSRDLIKESPAELEYVALADCDLRQMAAYQKWVAESLPGRLPAVCPQYQDYREMFDKEKLDAVVVATTTHARTLICLHAMQAGLDVYAEKPLTLTIEEGQYLVRAEKKYGRVFQTGTQQRSIPINNFGSDLVKNGAIGHVHTVECPIFIGPETRTQEFPARSHSAGNGLGQVVSSNGLDSLQFAAASEPRALGALARLRWRRIGLGCHGLGCPCVRSGAAGSGNRRHRPGRSVARRNRSELSRHSPIIPTALC